MAYELQIISGSTSVDLTNNIASYIALGYAVKGDPQITVQVSGSISSSLYYIGMEKYIPEQSMGNEDMLSLKFRAKYSYGGYPTSSILTASESQMFYR